MSGKAAIVGVVVVLFAPAAAQGVTRFAEPAGNGVEPCLQADPCEIEDAIEGTAGGGTGVNNGDEIVLEDGNYTIGTTVLTPFDNVTIRALDPADPPNISASGPFAIESAADVTLRDLVITHTASIATGSALFLRGAGAVVERNLVVMGGGGIACNVVDGFLRDSYCRGNASVGAAGAFITSPTGTYSADFVNVTAVTTGGGLGLVVNVSTGNTHNTVTARNTIASSVFVSNTGGATSSASATLSTSNFPSSGTNGGANTSATAAGPPNQTATPLLGDPFANDFHQQSGSPTIDAGAPQPGLLGTQDLDRALRTQGSSPDIGADEFPGLAVPAGTSPASPANENSPRLQGAAPSSATVRVFATADCSGLPLATGPAAEFASPGIAVSVADNTTTQLRATAADAGGGPQSACSSAVPYAEDSAAPTAPQVTATNPASPADDNNPEVSGAAETGSTVRVFSTADCSGSPLATGSAAAFASPGLTVAVADNTTTNLRATATDGVGNQSACSAPLQYVEQTTGGGGGGDVTPPETRIDSAPKPKIKTTKKKVRIQISFSANEPATFRCSLDGSAEKTCSSPFSAKVGKGAHTFEVTATDTAGNEDPSAAKTSFKVKRKKRRR